MGLRTPFAAGGYEIAALSAGLVVEAVRAVMAGDLENAYALSRPPGHHCLPDFPNGFCLLANIAIAIEAARARAGVGRVAVMDEIALPALERYQPDLIVVACGYDASAINPMARMRPKPTRSGR